MPKPFKISEKKTVWDLDEIDAWLESKKATRITNPLVPANGIAVYPSTITEGRKRGRPRKNQSGVDRSMGSCK